jgi:hypothetical protein
LNSESSHNHLMHSRALTLTRRVTSLGRSYASQGLSIDLFTRGSRRWIHEPRIPTTRDRLESLERVLTCVISTYHKPPFLELKNLIVKLLGCTGAYFLLNSVKDLIETQSLEPSAWAKAAMSNLYPIVQPEELEIDECLQTYADIVRGLYGSEYSPIKPEKLLQVLEPLFPAYSNITEPQLRYVDVIRSTAPVLLMTYHRVRDVVLDDNRGRNDVEAAMRVSDIVFECTKSLLSFYRAKYLERMALANKKYQEEKEMTREQLGSPYEMLD